MSVFTWTGCIDVTGGVRRGNNPEDLLYGGKDVDMKCGGVADEGFPLLLNYYCIMTAQLMCGCSNSLKYNKMEIKTCILFYIIDCL